MWSLTNHGGRDEPPAQLGGQFPRRGLPPVEPWGEVVERLFAPPRLVDALQERVRTGRRMGHVDQKGGVGRPRHSPQDLDAAVAQHFDGHLVVERASPTERVDRVCRSIGSTWGGWRGGGTLSRRLS